MAKRETIIYQLKVTLKDIDPPIWRRFLVRSNIKLSDLHFILQTIMGWTNSHLYQFIKDRVFYTESDPDWFDELPSEDSTKTKLDSLLTKKRSKLLYEYDFGDSWTHELVLEDILPKESKKYPICLDGARNCPLEDCGGVPGYYEILDALNDPDNPEYEEILEWADDYDPEYFDLMLITALLRQKKYGWGY